MIWQLSVSCFYSQDGNTDIDGLRAAIAEAKSVTDKPTLIKVRSCVCPFTTHCTATQVLCGCCYSPCHCR